MGPNDMQGYPPWSPWGQGQQAAQMQAGPQQQQPWGMPQPQPARNAPQAPWNAQRQSMDGQNSRNAPGPGTAASGKKRPSAAANLVLNLLTLCFVGFLLAESTIFAFSNNENKSLFGYRFYNVLTPSMRPLFRPGDMIFVKLTDPSQVRVGDVVTFRPSSKSTAFLTHRVAELLPAQEMKPARMVTKGDANNAADPPVALSAVIGVHVFTIPFVGWIAEMARSSLPLVCVCFGAVFLLLLVLRAYFAVRKESRGPDI